ncbi:MAG: hypothetical protein KA397_04170 [Paludibacteraceae bacterium]|nr:hypothetical protein [Paludibacteraceae bacterium]MBP6284813.1 hypothetical protein [Paludibacteraceae bacterium]
MRNLILYSLFILFCTSCEKWNIHTYEVPADFAPYVDKFKADAKRYGHNFDNKGLIVRFANLDNNIAGLAYYKRNPVLIEIDADYWSTAGKAKNAHDIKEDLIFHELGHGLLKRMHNNTVLQNGDWKTMMCGDELPNDRSSNINYRGFRKEYYIEELFTNMNEVPEWSTFTPEFENIDETAVIEQDFSSNSDWTIGENTLYESKIENGIYSFTTKSSQSFYVLNKGSVETTQNFYFEARIKVTSNETDATVGLVYGSYKDDTNPTSVHYFYHNNKKHTYVGESECLGPFIDLYIDGIQANDFNTLAVRKKDNSLYYYINGNFIYHSDLDDVIEMYGNQIGFKIPGNSTLYVDYATVKQSENSGVRNRSKSTQAIEETKDIEVKKWVK